MIKQDRSLVNFILLNLITCGIYSWFFVNDLANDMNTMCEGDGKNTQGLLAYILLSAVTCGIYSFFWWYNVADRLAYNAPRYELRFTENGTTVLMWFIFGSLICGVGAFVGINIVINNTNSMANRYNSIAR